MRSLHICQRDDLSTGGAARVAVEFAKRLPRHAVETRCVFVYGEPGPFSEELAGAAIHLKLRSSKDAITRFGELRNCILREKPDLIHHHDGLAWTHLVTRSFRNLVRIGHGHLSPPPRGAGLKNRLAHLIQKQNYHHLICVSEATRQDWITEGFPGTRTTVIGNGVDLARFKPFTSAERQNLRHAWGLTDPHRAVGFVGRLDSEMKGCREFIDLIARLPDPFIGIMAGDGPDRAALVEHATRTGLQDRIRFLGSVDPAREVYGGLDTFVLLSRYEPFGLVLLEAAAMGLPIVVLPGSGGSLEVARRLGARILPDRSLETLADAVIVASSDPVTHSFHSPHDTLDEFSWDRSTALMVEVYQRVTKRPFPLTP